MRKRHRVTARRPPSAEGSEFVNVLFSELVVGSKDEFVELESCIPFTKIRPLSSSGVRRLINSFSSKNDTSTEYEDDTPYHSTGLALGSDMAMVVPLNGSYISYVKDHFLKAGLNEDDVRDRLASRSQWYGVVDGLHSHAALTFLKENNSSWKEFKWYVKILNGGFPVEKYRQLGRVQNSRHHPFFYVEFTLFDVLYNLRIEHEKLKRENRKCGGSETANAYDGAQHARSSTLQQKANVSIRLPIEVLEEMGKIMNKDHPDLILSLRKRKVAQLEENNVMEKEDCRFFKGFINISTLKGSSSFMNSKEKDSHLLQINCLHRVKDVYSETHKTIKSEDLTKQFKYSKMAQNEHDKFLRFIESESWPTEMETLKQNLLRSTILDKELDENNNNEYVILPKLLDAYRRHFPETANMKEAKWKSSTEETIDILSGANNNDTNKENENEMEPPVAPYEDETTEVLNNLNENQILEDNNINVYNMTWKDYLINERKSDFSRFDLLLTRPPGAPSRSFIRTMRAAKGDEEIEKDEMEEFIKFSKRILKSGGYIFLMIHFTAFREWYELLDSAGFTVMPEEFLISYDLRSIKKRKILHFTQSAHDVAILGRLPGEHPDKFKPEFLSTDKDNETSGDILNGTRFSIISNAPVMKSHLTKCGSKVPFDLKEFDSEVFREIIELFTPVNGSVIDPYCRTMTTGLACLKSMRSCHLIEKSKLCYESALIRLRKAASPLPSTDSILHQTYMKPSRPSSELEDEAVLDALSSSQNCISTEHATQSSNSESTMTTDITSNESFCDSIDQLSNDPLIKT